MSAKADKHDADGGLQRARNLLGDRVTYQDCCAGENEERQRVAEPPCQAVLDDITNVGSASPPALVFAAFFRKCCHRRN